MSKKNNLRQSSLKTSAFPLYQTNIIQQKYKETKETLPSLHSLNNDELLLQMEKAARTSHNLSNISISNSNHLTLSNNLQRKCDACETEEKKQDEMIQKKENASTGEQVQRFFGGLFGDSSDDSKTTESPPCKEPYPTPPSLGSWLDNSALEAIRHNGKVLSQSQSPNGDSKEATRLVKQLLLAWGCEFYRQNLLPKFGVNSTFGTETKMALQQFQTYFALGSDGIIGIRTLEAMDVYMGVSRPSKPEKPKDVGGDNMQGKSKFNSKNNPVAQIYFPTDGDVLDTDDVLILHSLANSLENAESVSLNFYGYSDKREAADYNLKLADRRAESVCSSLLRIFDERNISYDWDIIPLGEIERPQTGKTSEELKPFRRVDVVIEDIKWPIQDPTCDDLLCIPVKPVKPTKLDCSKKPSRDWLIKMENISIVATSAPSVKKVKGVGLIDVESDVTIWSPEINCEQEFKFEGTGTGATIDPRPRTDDKIDKLDWYPFNLRKDSNLKSFENTGARFGSGNLFKKWVTFTFDAEYVNKVGNPVGTSEFVENVWFMDGSILVEGFLTGGRLKAKSKAQIK